MRKICFVTTISMTLKAFIIDTAKYLHEEGNYDITFICDYDEEFKDLLPSYIKYIPVSMKRGINLYGIKAILKMQEIFKKEKFDIVQYSTPNASCYASIAAMIARVPVRLYCQWGIAYVAFSGHKRKIFKLIEKMVCKFSTWIEPDSMSNLKFSHEEGLYVKQKSSVVWNGSASGVNLKKFDIKHKAKWRKEIRSKYGLDENSFVIGFVGRITHDKGVNELFAACKKLFGKEPNFYLIMIGDNEKSKSIDEKLYQWSLSEERVIYCGKTNEVEKYMSALDIFILPSYREGFGSVVIEAEAMGVPVIVTNIPGPIDAMLANETGLIVEKGSSLSLLEIIDKMAYNPTMCSIMSENAVNFVKDKFDQEILVKKILEDRERLLKIMIIGDEACQ